MLSELKADISRLQLAAERKAELDATIATVERKMVERQEYVEQLLVNFGSRIAKLERGDNSPLPGRQPATV